MVRVETCLLSVLLVLTVYVNACMGDECGSGVAKTISVGANQQFTSVQRAIDSIPSGNSRWIHVFIHKGYYKEKVIIPKEKGCIYIEGEVEGQTTIAWGDHGSVTSSSTFTAYSNNIAIKNMVFKNTYILSDNPGAPLQPALAVSLQGDKYSLYRCKFLGLQDTVWDAEGRHYFKNCYISGAVDFIWGFAQSLYEGCAIEVTLKPLSDASHRTGMITAQGRNSNSETNGYVFKWCNVYGDRTLLGRAYRPYSRVIFFESRLSASVQPLGWDAWYSKDHEGETTYVEAYNTGAGANTAHRVPWMKRMTNRELIRFVDLRYINQDNWISRLPSGALA